MRGWSKANIVRGIGLLALSGILLWGCRGQVGELLPTASPPPTATWTPWPPSPTPVPVAAEVNGEAITVEEVQAEMARLQAAAAQLGMNLAPEEAWKRALDDLIDQVLLAQAAVEQGFDLDAAVQQGLTEAQAAYPSTEAFLAYLASLGLDEAGYRAWLGRAMAAAWMRDRIAAQVPTQAEQVHAQQILIYNEQEARQVWQALQNGADFDQWAAVYDPQNRGDLGWFPRGVLSEPALEKAAFQLEVGAISPVIATPLGYHILRVLERQSARPLSTPARQMLQQRALAQWLQARRAQSEIRLGPSPYPTSAP